MHRNNDNLPLLLLLTAQLTGHRHISQIGRLQHSRQALEESRGHAKNTKRMIPRSRPQPRYENNIGAFDSTQSVGTREHQALLLLLLNATHPQLTAPERIPLHAILCFCFRLVPAACCGRDKARSPTPTIPEVQTMISVD